MFFEHCIRLASGGMPGSWARGSGGAVMPPHPVAVFAAEDGAPPVFVRQIPVHSLLQPVFESAARGIAEFAPQAGLVDGVAAVVAGAVAHELDAAGVRRARRTAFVHDRAQGVHHLEVGALGTAADVVSPPGLATFENQFDAAAVVFHVQPIAHVLTVAVDRQRLAVEQVDQAQRDQLFRKLVWAVIVGAVADRGGQAIGVVIGAHQMVGGGLAGGIGRVGGIGGGFAKRRIVRSQGAVYLVGGHVMETVRWRGAVFEPGGAGSLEQAVGAEHVGVDEGVGPGDGAVDMAFGGEMHDRVYVFLAQQALDPIGVADVTVHEAKLRKGFERGQAGAVAGVG